MNSHFIQFFTSLLEGFLNISSQLVWMLENNLEFFSGTQITIGSVPLLEILRHLLVKVFHAVLILVQIYHCYGYLHNVDMQKAGVEMYAARN